MNFDIVCAAVVAERVVRGDQHALLIVQIERGLLAGGTGIGVCMSANRHRGVRAADCYSPHHAEMARRHYDANVLCLGGRLMGSDEAWAITEVWLATRFDGGRHARRVAAMDDWAGAPR